MDFSWDPVIASNKYINTKNNGSKDEHSFCSLVDRPLTHSQNIMLGNCMQEALHDGVKMFRPDLKDVRGPASKKGEKQKDHAWFDPQSRMIYYGEQKNNINLDTEKSKATNDKVDELSNKLSKLAKEFPDCTVDGFVLATRYLSANETIAQKLIRTKYKNTKVLGVNEYLELFGLPPFKDYEHYKLFINNIIDTKFSSCE